jgi:putative transposase
MQAVETIRAKERRVGTRKLVDRLHKHHDTKVGRDRLFNLLRNAGRLVKVKKRFEKTTYSRHGYAVAPNRIKGRKITKPNQVLVCDCTYLRLRGRQFAYLFLVSDAYTRCIVGHHVSRDLSHHSAVIALSKAAAWLQEFQGVSGQGVILHSDRGCQYCCHEYLAMLRSYGMESSMTDADHCYQNAIAERINGILKDEFDLDAEFADINHVRTSVQQAVEVYNTMRTHWSLGLRTPQEMYAQARLSTQGRCGSEGSY